MWSTHTLLQIGNVTGPLPPDRAHRSGVSHGLSEPRGAGGLARGRERRDKLAAESTGNFLFDKLCGILASGISVK